MIFLGLAHTCEGVKLCQEDIQLAKVQIPKDREYKTVNYMTLYNIDPYLNFQRAVDEMFAGKGNIFVECRTSFLNLKIWI